MRDRSFFAIAPQTKPSHFDVESLANGVRREEGDGKKIEDRMLDESNVPCTYLYCSVPFGQAAEEDPKFRARETVHRCDFQQCFCCLVLHSEECHS